MNKVMHKINSSFNIYTYISIALCSATLLSTILLSSSIVSANTDSTDTVSLTVPIACTMTGEGTSHTATLDPGTYSGATGSEYENGIGKTTLTAICNDDNGFSIYAIGYTGNQYEGENHTKLVGSTTGGTIATKAYASGDTTSNWSMKLTKITDSAESYNPQNLTIQSDTEGTFSNWHSIPSTYTKVAQYHASTGSSTTDTTLGVKLETTYAAYISSSQPADTYVGQVKYTIVHPYTEAPLQPQTTASGKICYYPNGSNVEGTMGCQEIPTSGGSADTVSPTSATLLASNYSRQGYGFAGWSDKFDYATNSEAKFYGPQETITYENGQYVGEGKGLSLYAVWVRSQGSIQDQNKVASVCSSLAIAPTDGTANLSSVSAFTDSRDNNTYAIAKLADGKCWMVENLRLDNSATLTIANTNNPLNDGTNVTLKHNYTDTTTNNTLSPTSSAYYNADTAPDGWCTVYSDACNNQSRLRTDNTANRATYTENQIVTSQDANIYSYGNYYNWYSATAGNGTYSFSTDNNSVAGDLCPAGWHLPKGGSSENATNSDFWQLSLRTMGFAPSNNNYYQTDETDSVGKTATATVRSYPYNYLYSGYVNGGSLFSRGSYGRFWSSTVRSTNFAYDLYIYSSNLYPGTYSYSKYLGRPVRCLVGFTD